MKTIPSWSYSRLDVFEQCPHRAYLAYIEKSPEPPRVIPDGMDMHPLDRGLAVHSDAENYIISEILLPPSLKKFESDFVQIKTLPAEYVFAEKKMAFDSEWNKTDFYSRSAWLRMVVDLLVFDEANKTLRVIDHKTGKKYPVKHIQQGQLYAIACALLYPEYETFNTEFWYLDSGDKLERSYSLTQCLMFKDDFNRRGKEMTETLNFPVKASAWTCKWCPYNKTERGTGACEFAYDYDNKDTAVRKSKTIS